jgi:colicin import membrane protein
LSGLTPRKEDAMKIQILGALAATTLLAAGCQDDARRAREARAEEAKTIQHAEERKAEIDRDAMNKKADLTRDELKAQRDAADKLSRERVSEVDHARHPADENDTTLRNRDVGEIRDREVGTARSGGVTSGPVEAAELSIVGIVKDAGHDSLKVVTRNKGELAVKTDDATRVLRHGVRVKLNDIREGTEVRVSYRYDGKQNKADRIEVERDLR